MAGINVLSIQRTKLSENSQTQRNQAIGIKTESNEIENKRGEENDWKQKTILWEDYKY